MRNNYELVADLVKRYDEAIFVAENRYKGTVSILLSIIFFFLAGYFLLDAFLFLKVSNAHYFYGGFLLLGILNIAWSNKKFITQVHILIAEFIFYNEIAGEFERIQHNVLLDLVKHIDEIQTMSKEEFGPWSEHAKKALWILEADYKWKLLT